MSGWALIKTVFDKGISNMSEQKAGETAAQQSNDAARDPSMTYAAPDQDQTGRGLTTARYVDRIAGWGDGSVQMNPLMSQPAEMEKGMGTAAPAAGGFALQPAHVDSSQPTGPDSRMAQYLNYMKYRGGY